MTSFGLSMGMPRPLTAAGVGGGFVDIVNNGVLAPFVTFTRAGDGTYFDSAGVMQTAAVNEPRVDYDPVTLELRGLLIEEQRTNLVASSGDPTAWDLSAMVAAGNDAVGPDGTLSMTRFTDDAAGGATGNMFCGNPNNLTVPVDTVVSYSVFIRKGSLTSLRFDTRNDDQARGGEFDLATGAFTPHGTSPGATGRLRDVGSGILRVEVTWTTGTDTLIKTRIGPAGSPLRDGSNYFHAWGAQLEVGAFATSYIPTTTAAVTRAADVASFTIPAGIVRLEYTYDDGTTADVAVTPGAAYQIPTGQKRIKHLRGYRS